MKMKLLKKIAAAALLLLLAALPASAEKRFHLCSHPVITKFSLEELRKL